jgi:hypothetical protein
MSDLAHKEIAHMVELARERGGWVHREGLIYEPYQEGDEKRYHTIAVVKRVTEGDFIAAAGRTLSDLADQVAAAHAWAGAVEVELQKLLDEQKEMRDELSALQERNRWQPADIPPPARSLRSSVSDTVLCYLGLDEDREPIRRLGYYSHRNKAWSHMGRVGWLVRKWMYMPTAPDEEEVVIQ